MEGMDAGNEGCSYANQTQESCSYDAVATPDATEPYLASKGVHVNLIPLSSFLGNLTV